MSQFTEADHVALRDAVNAGQSWRAIGRTLGIHHNNAKRMWESVVAMYGADWAAGNATPASAAAEETLDLVERSNADVIADAAIADGIAKAVEAGEMTVFQPETSDVPEPTSKSAAYPDGVCSPTEFRNLIVEAGLVPDTFRRQQVYSWIKSSKRNPFPVKHYRHDDATECAEASEFTRPGVQVAAAKAWVAAKFAPVAE